MTIGAAVVMVMVVAGRGVSPRPIKYKYQAAVLNLKKVDLDFSQLPNNQPEDYNNSLYLQTFSVLTTVEFTSLNIKLGTYHRRH